MKAALIDTDILSYFLSGRETVKSRVEEYLLTHRLLSFSEISYFEILAGLEYKMTERQLKQFEMFVLKCNIIKLDKHSIRLSAKAYAVLRRKGIQIGTPDLLIAGTALAHELELVTNNEKHYSHIPGLFMNNWMKN